MIYDLIINSEPYLCVDPLIGGAIIGGVGNLIGGLFGSKANKNTNQQNLQIALGVSYGKMARHFLLISSALMVLQPILPQSLPLAMIQGQYQEADNHRSGDTFRFHGAWSPANEKGIV